MEIARFGLVSVAIMASIAACSSADEEPSREPATGTASPKVATLSVSGGAFHAPDTIDAGWTTLRFTNDSDDPVHYAHVVRLDSGQTVPALVEFYAKAIRESGPRPGWIVRVGGPGGAGPHQTASVTQLLAPGSYVWICPVENEQGEPHFGAGEYREFVVRPAGDATASAAAEPVATATVRLVDHAFNADSSLMKSGRHVIRVENDGREPHDMNMMKLSAGRTMEDLQRFMNPERARRPGASDDPPPPLHEIGSMVGGVAAMAPGMSAYIDAELTPGEYLLFCMVTAPDGKSHIEHGMIRQVRVQ